MTGSSPSVTLSSRANRSDEVLAQEVGNEVVLLDLASEQYFGLDPVGARIWELLADGPMLKDICYRLSQEFDAPPTQIQTDLLALVRQLSAAGLIRLE